METGQRTLKVLGRGLLMMVFLSLMVSCTSDHSIADLESYVLNTHKDSTPKVEPLPTLPAILAFEYAASAMTDPFSPENVFPKIPVKPDSDPEPTADPLTPDPDRQKETLEKYPLDTLRFAGTLTLAKVTRLVVVAPDGLVYKVPAGGYLGQNHGRVTSIDSQTGTIELQEVILGISGRWELRTVKLTIR